MFVRTDYKHTDIEVYIYEYLEQIMRIDADRKPALAAGQQDLVELQSALVKHGPVMRTLPERRDASDHIAGLAHRDLRVGHRCLLRTDRRRQRLQIHVSADRHHAHHTLGTGVGHQRLEHLMLIESELLRGFHPVTVIHVVVGMLVLVGLERHSGLLQLHSRRRGAGTLLMLRFFAHVFHTTALKTRRYEIGNRHFPTNGFSYLRVLRARIGKAATIRRILRRSGHWFHGVAARPRLRSASATAPTGAPVADSPAAAYPSAPTFTVEPPVSVTLPSTASVEHSPAAMPGTVAAPSLALNTLT